ncbi:MAG: PAS domain S-box protein [Mucilaginibacter sp.]|uniref:PAS domain S-box protein n=1 Tax=Mucilaginibacter sp. TaxID=1882438 RepID=UPI00326648FA
MLDKLLLVLNDCAWAYSLTEKKYVFISPNIRSVVGISAEELIADKDSLLKIILPEDEEMILKAYRDLQLEETAELYYRVNVNNKVKWLFEKRSYFVDWASNAEIILSVIKDVSDQQVIKNHLNDALGNFSVLFDKNPSPMWVYETPSLRIIKVNQAAIDHYGYSSKDFLNMTIRDIRPKLDLAAFNEYIFRKGIIKGKKIGSNPSGVWRHQNKQGEIIYAEVTGHELKYNNTTCRIVVVNDVTERLLFEQERDCAADLENSN